MSQINEANITFAPLVNWQFSALSLANDKCKNLILKSYIDDCLHLNAFNLNILRDGWVDQTDKMLGGAHSNPLKLAATIIYQPQDRPTPNYTLVYHYWLQLFTNCILCLNSGVS